MRSRKCTYLRRVVLSESRHTSALNQEGVVFEVAVGRTRQMSGR